MNSFIAFVLICLFQYILSDEFYDLVQLHHIKNTQIASAAVCPKCLETNEGRIRFSDCLARDSNNNIYKEQRYNMIATSENKFFYYVFQRYKKSIYPFPNNLISSNYGHNQLEIIPTANDGGHYIKLFDRNLCLYHDYTLSNQYANSNSNYFVSCDYTSKFFKFYFFQSDYTFPDFKVTVYIYLYQIYNVNSKILKNFDELLSSKSLVSFQEKTTKEIRTYSFSSNASTIEAQLYIGQWEVNVSVINSSVYYYKDDIKYYVPIVICNENKNYGAEVPIRYLLNDSKNNSGGEMVLLTVTASRDVYIKNMNVRYRSCLLCTGMNVDGSWNTNLCSTSNFSMKKGDCMILVQTNANNSNKKELEQKLDILDYMQSTDYNLTSFQVGHSCQLDSNYNNYRHELSNNSGITHYYKYYCFSNTQISIDYFDSTEIYESWK